MKPAKSRTAINLIVLYKWDVWIHRQIPSHDLAVMLQAGQSNVKLPAVNRRWPVAAENGCGKVGGSRGLSCWCASAQAASAIPVWLCRIMELTGVNEQARFVLELEFIQCLANPHYLNCKLDLCVLAGFALTNALQMAANSASSMWHLCLKLYKQQSEPHWTST